MFITSNVFAQIHHNKHFNPTEEDRDNFLLLFEDKINQSESSKNKDSLDYFTLIPERLPKWINKIPISSENKVYMLGISDPGMSKEAGFLLASLRLKIAYCLLMETLVTNMRDFYTREKSNQHANTSIDYTRFVSQAETDFSRIKVINKHITKYDETILLGKIDLSRPKTEKNQRKTAYKSINYVKCKKSRFTH